MNYIFDSRRYTIYSIILIITFWIIGDLTTTYVALSLGGVESGYVASNIIYNYSIINNILYKTIITVLYLSTIYIMDKYIEYNSSDMSENQYNFYKLIPTSLIILIIFNGVYLTINNLYVIYILLV